MIPRIVCASFRRWNNVIVPQLEPSKKLSETLPLPAAGNESLMSVIQHSPTITLASFDAADITVGGEEWYTEVSFIVLDSVHRVALPEARIRFVAKPCTVSQDKTRFS